MGWGVLLRRVVGVVVWIVLKRRTRVVLEDAMVRCLGVVLVLMVRTVSVVHVDVGELWREWRGCKVEYSAARCSDACSI